MRHSPLLSRLGYYKWSNRFRDWRCRLVRLTKYHDTTQAAEWGDRIDEMCAYNAFVRLRMLGHDHAKLHVGPYIITILCVKRSLIVRYEEGPQ